MTLEQIVRQLQHGLYNNLNARFDGEAWLGPTEHPKFIISFKPYDEQVVPMSEVQDYIDGLQLTYSGARASSDDGDVYELTIEDTERQPISYQFVVSTSKVSASV